MTQQVDDGPVASRKRFFDRPTTGKAVLVVAAYLAYYLLVSLAVGAVFGDEIDPDDPLATGLKHLLRTRAADRDRRRDRARLHRLHR